MNSTTDNNYCENPKAVIKKLNVSENTKTTMNEMFQSLLPEANSNGGYKFKKSKNNRMNRFNKTKNKNKFKKGGNGCKTAKYAIIIASIAASLIGVYSCVASNQTSDYSALIIWSTNQFRQSIINLFNIADNYANVQSGKLNILQATLESFGKLNLLNVGLEKITAYYNRLKTVQNIEDVLPKPLSNFLDIFCQLETNKINLEQAKEETKKQLEISKEASEIQQILPQDEVPSSKIAEMMRKEGNSIIIENINPNQIVKINVNIIDKQVHSDDSDDSLFFESLQYPPAKSSLHLNEYP